MSLILSKRGCALSLSAIRVYKCVSSSSNSATLPSAAFLSEGEESVPHFLCCTSLARSFNSSNGFVLFSLSLNIFLSLSFLARLALCLLTFACSFSLVFA